MKKFLRIFLMVIAVLAVALLVRLAMLGQSSKSGQAPGLISGSLAACPDKPNCVCSEFVEDAEHYIEPLDYSVGSSEEALGKLSQIIEDLGGEVVVSKEGYIAATFASFLFGFVDDVECRLDAYAERIQIRSASREGHSDLGVNRKRAEALTRAFNQER
jgi:uncharacterized protein (DUF1499 family)